MVDSELENMTTKSILNTLKSHPSNFEIFEKIKGLVEELSFSNLEYKGDVTTWLTFEYLRNSLIMHDYDELDVFDSIEDEIVIFQIFKSLT